MECPKCGYKQTENLAECANCGVIFSKIIDREDNLSDGLIAVIDSPTTKVKKPTSGNFFTMLKIMAVTILAFLLIVSIINLYVFYACNRPPGCTLWGEFKIEYFDLTYKQFHQTKYAPRIKIPESSENIDIFRYGARDCGNIAIQAKVKNGVPDLHAIISDFTLSNVTQPILVENVSSPMEALSIVVGGCGAPQPLWMQIDDPMNGFNRNVLKYGFGGTRGRGVWAFYNEETQTLRVFIWQQQHLSNDRFQPAVKI